VTLQRILLVAFATVLVAGLVPAGFLLDRSVARELESRAAEELSTAPRVLADRNSPARRGWRRLWRPGTESGPGRRSR
jgi:hypothetical protein